MTEHDVTYRIRTDQLSWREVEGEIVLLDERDWTYLHLNGTGATVWRTIAADGGATLPQLVTGLLAEYDVEQEIAAADVDALIGDLLKRELITSI